MHIYIGYYIYILYYIIYHISYIIYHISYIIYHILYRYTCLIYVSSARLLRVRLRVALEGLEEPGLEAVEGLPHLPRGRLVVAPHAMAIGFKPFKPSLSPFKAFLSRF